MVKFIASICAFAAIVGCGIPTHQDPQAGASQTEKWTLEPFVKVDSVNPILLPSKERQFACPILKKTVFWEEKDVFNPAAVVKDGKVWLLYRAEDVIGRYAGTSRIGVATSTDGLHFEKMAAPVLFPDNDFMKKYEWEGGVEDPRVVESADGTYVMTYTAYDGKVARLCLATSKDLLRWEKRGLVLSLPKYADKWSKSGAIVCKKVGEKIVAERINGKYWMYFGDTNLFMAFSDDLIHWQPFEDADGQLIPVLYPRAGYFDSRLVESGPFALITEGGILLLYNSMNAQVQGDTTLKVGTYAAGQALFDARNPTKLLKRTNDNFFRPEKDYERVGQVNEVCFIEGLVHFRNQWLLYYGTADSKIAVAVCKP